MGTDETQPEVQPATPEPAQEPAPAAPVPPAAPVAEPAPAPSTGPQVTPDPTPGDTPSTSPAPSAPAAGETPAPVVASPVRVDSRSARDDNDALEGHFCQIVAGPDQGRRGVFESVQTYDPQTGYPAHILVRTRDAQNELLNVEYADVRPTPDYSGGR